jgi:phospholipid/cholesterol/gamma-HCH transport system permease protein
MPMSNNSSFIESQIVEPSCNWLADIGRYVVMCGRVVALTVTRRPRWDLVLIQLYEIGVRSLPLVCITGVAIGMVLSAQSFFQLSDKGLTGATGLMVAKSMLVEIGPVLTAFIMTGRVGAAICAELGSMRVSEQIDAMACMGVDPLEYLVVPRYLAMAVMMPVLTVFSSAAGIFGGWFLAVYLYGMNTQTFFDPVQVYLTWFDVICNFVKSWFFGLLIVSVACFEGMSVRGGAAGVGRSTTTSVVVAYSSILGANFLLTIFLNALYWYLFGFA